MKTEPKIPSKEKVSERGNLKMRSRPVRVLSIDTVEQLEVRAQTTTAVLQRFLDFPLPRGF
jgi:hypothetical protein